MRSYKWPALVATAGLGLGLLTLANATSHGQAPAAKPGVLWEYKELFGDIRQANDESLNKAGQEGWELVAVGGDPRNVPRYTFKRSKQK